MLNITMHRTQTSKEETGPSQKRGKKQTPGGRKGGALNELIYYVYFFHGGGNKTYNARSYKTFKGVRVERKIQNEECFAHLQGN